MSPTRGRLWSRYSSLGWHQRSLVDENRLALYACTRGRNLIPERNGDILGSPKAPLAALCIDPSSLCSQECWPDIHHERADPALLPEPPPSIQTFMKYNTLSLPLPQFSLWVGSNFDPLRSCEVDLAVNQTGAQD
ncbi:conserved hypothetical protein [Coccidioides posadasii str. Silveira]|uniref:Uncharacterized protein n=2 Tax=Coccidioides posadasii TaxID=199306 RepID=E9CV65_COCPS|nr:conserved hypothetical protein [Coccidioides posadasii str. Silveira]KMM65531.1 hypothetical protein CPAG_01880 [Coccidioides posadasii RMSCC 3488]